VDVWSLLEGARERAPQGLAVADGPRRLAYGELHRRASALARALAARGVARGDRVAILAWNGAEYVEATFAAAGLGAVLVPVNARLADPEVAAILGLAGARAAIVSPDLAREVPGVLRIGPEYEAELARHAGPWTAEPAAPDEVAHLYFTSGTTGLPKGVPLTHRNVCAHAAGRRRRARARPPATCGPTWRRCSTSRTRGRRWRSRRSAASTRRSRSSTPARRSR
jgi:acyl-CoA synthetase (AMP-forming)/AMP-acid ligase II